MERYLSVMQKGGMGSGVGDIAAMTEANHRLDGWMLSGGRGRGKERGKRSMLSMVREGRVSAGGVVLRMGCASIGIGMELGGVIAIRSGNGTEIERRIRRGRRKGDAILRRRGDDPYSVVV